jgi:nitrate reductase gamma subunit
MPHVGLLLLLLGFVFGMIATVDSPTVSDMSKAADSAKYSTLSTTLLLSGGFMLVAGSLH